MRTRDYKPVEKRVCIETVHLSNIFGEQIDRLFHNRSSHIKICVKAFSNARRFYLVVKFFCHAPYDFLDGADLNFRHSKTRVCSFLGFSIEVYQKEKRS